MTIEEGDTVFFDLGYGVESGTVLSLSAAEAEVGIVADGPRTLSRGEIFATREGVPA